MSLHCERIILFIFQAGILAVGRGNRVVEPIIGSDGKMFFFVLLCLQLFEAI